jgi:hypothetical protein
MSSHQVWIDSPSWQSPKGRLARTQRSPSCLMAANTTKKKLCLMKACGYRGVGR